MIKFSIIIPTYNNFLNCLRPCIESITQYTDLSNVEIIIVANGCIDETKMGLKTLPNTIFKVLWFDEAIGYTKAINEGLKICSGEYIVLLNNDTVLLPQEKNTWLNLLVEPFKDKKVGITGPLMGFSPETSRPFLIFFCVMISREIYQKFGLLDEIYNPGFGEDTQYCHQVEDSGYQIIQVPQEQLRIDNNLMIGSFPIYHQGEATFNKLQNGSEIIRKNSEILKSRYSKNNSPKLYDCFPFYNELDLLEIRLNEMSEIVEKFVIVEATKTHSGKPKPLYFEENKHLFHKFLKQINHIIIDFPDNLDVWGRERYQRDSIMKGLEGCKLNDIIIVSDADEIPRCKTIKSFINNPNRNTDIIYSLDQKLHYYYLNNVGDTEKEAKILNYEILKKTSPCFVRYSGYLNIIENGGWHFSFLGNPEKISKKIDSYAHQEYNNSQINNLEHIKNSIKNGIDIFNRKNMKKFKTIEIDDTYPDYIIKNKQKYIENGLINDINFGEKNKNPKFSIIIPTFNKLEECLRPCVESLIKYTNLKDVEVIIVANGCTDKTVKYLKTLPEKIFKTLWYDEAIGYTKATNNGIKASIGEYIVLLNNDTVFLQQEKNAWLNLLLQPFENNKTWITGPAKEYDVFSEREFLIFFCVMIKKEAFQKIGLLDEEFSPGFCEDVDFSIKVQDLGYQITKVDIPIFHKYDITFRETYGQEGSNKLMNKNRMKIVQKYNKNWAKMDNKEKSNYIEKYPFLKEFSKENIKQESTVTATISTKNRYFTTLPNVIFALAMQTRPPEKLIIFDDGEKKDLRENPIYKNLFSLLDNKGIKWAVIFGEGKGQIFNHQKAIDICDTTYIYRCDDDASPEPNVLENLLKTIESDEKIGAVGGLVLDPKSPNISGFVSSKIEDIFCSTNVQWVKHNSKELIDVDHLYSTFLFKKEAGKHGYNLDLSPVGHREETLFSYTMKLNNWKLLVNPNIITWHLRDPSGGIRSHSNEFEFYYRNDNRIFNEKLKEWKITPSKLVVLKNGMGDHVMFRPVLQKLKQKHNKIILACGYPDIFKYDIDKSVKLITLEEASTFCNIEDFNIYDWCTKNNWKEHLIKAFEKFYGV